MARARASSGAILDEVGDPQTWEPFPDENGDPWTGQLTDYVEPRRRLRPSDIRAQDRRDREEWTTRMEEEGLDPETGAPLESRSSSAKSSSGSSRALRNVVEIVNSKRGATVSGALLGLLAYAVMANALAGGWAQVKGWLAAKFANVPYTPAPAPAPSSSAAPAPAPAGAAILTFPTPTVVPPGSVA